VAGSRQNDIWEVDDDPDVMVEGQSDAVFGIAAYPDAQKPGIYATGCEDGHVYMWHADDRQCLKSFLITRQKPVKGYGPTPLPAGEVCRGAWTRVALGRHALSAEQIMPLVTLKHFSARQVLKVKAVCFSDQADYFALSTSGVVKPEGADEEWEHEDKGGVLQVFTVSETWLQDDNDMEEPFDEVDFVKAHFAWETKDVNEAIDDIKFSPSGRFFAAGDHENTIIVYDAGNSFGKHCTLRGHSAAVMHFDWSCDGDFIVSNSNDYEILYWNVTAERPGQTTDDMRDLKLSSFTGNLGFPVMGMWQDGMDGTDINGVHRSHNENFMVLSGDDGLVRMFNYPCVIKEAPHRAFRAHSSHVQNCRFLVDDNRVITAGGADRSMMQWKTHGVTAPSSHFPMTKMARDRAVKPKPFGACHAPDARSWRPYM
jgi:WD40 repeat protein